MHGRKAMKKTKTEKSRKYEWLGCYLTEYPLIGAGPVLTIVERANSREELIPKMKGLGCFMIIKAEICEQKKGEQRDEHNEA